MITTVMEQVERHVRLHGNSALSINFHLGTTSDCYFCLSALAASVGIVFFSEFYLY